MTKPIPIKADPQLDLVIERVVDVPSDLVWKAWTEPEHLKHWLSPRPWRVVECEVDLRPGGIFRFNMQGPDGDRSDNNCSFLEIVPGQRLVWTDSLLAGWRPAAAPFLGMTAVITLEAMASRQTRYVATVLHRDEEGRRKHEEMGFHEGWGTATDQMVEHIKTL
jgi:uncharacterized protein YndB with AHSA1/START domain